MHPTVADVASPFLPSIRHAKSAPPCKAKTLANAQVFRASTAEIYPLNSTKTLNFFEGQSGLSFDLLKTIGEFVRGYEVESCPLKLWEDAILQGYAVFRQIRANNGGVVIGSRTNRRISYKSLPGKQ